jgi:DNA-binding CsgD family transcriptional regulator
VVFLSVFGFYNLWGTGFISYILAPFEENDLTTALLRFLHYLSLPFIMAGWLMLIRFENAISNKIWPFWLFIMLLTAVLAMLILAGLFPFSLPFSRWIIDSQKMAITVLNLAFFFYTGTSLLFFRQEKSEWAESRPVFWLGFAFLSMGLIQIPGLALPGLNFWSDVAFILLFFISLLLPLVVLYRSPLIKKKKDAASIEIKGFRAFCLEYEISPREAEIVLEICQGKSNREISDTLFISLQTVKDHAHRIFTKTGVKSRVQLTNLVRESK